MRLRDLVCLSAFFSREMIHVRPLSWKTFCAFGALILLFSAPRFGHAGDPESNNFLDTPGAGPQLRLAIHLSTESASPAAADWLDRFAGLLGGDQGGVEIVRQGHHEAAAYRVELGLRRDETRQGSEQLRVRVLSRDQQVLLAFRTSLDDERKALEESAQRLTTWFDDKEWRSSIASLEDGRITIHGGSRNQLKPGLVLQAVAHQPVYDDAGHQLGKASAPIGRLRLVEVDERTAVAEVIDGCKELTDETEVILAQTAP